MDAFIYTRLSHDPDGTQTATARQEADARALCRRNQWDVAAVHEDAGLSAYQTRRRPAFEALLRDARPGMIIVCWRVDRLARASRDWGRLLVLVDDGEVRIVGVSDGVDTATTGGRLTLGILAEVARNESATLAVRTKRKHVELAANGRRSGGGTRPFGLTADWSELVEAEAEVVREGVRRVLAGDSIHAILRDWNRRGILTSAGGRWNASPLRRMLRSARIAGARDHAGTLVARGAIPAIIGVDELLAVRVILDDPERRTTPGSRVRVNLLPGFAFCGRCDAPLVGRPRSDGVRRYLCPADLGRSGCNGLAILAEPTEALVVDSVFAVLDTPRLSALLADQSDADETRAAAHTLEATEASLAELARDYYVRRVLGRVEFFAARAELAAQGEAARDVLTRTARRGVLAGVHSSTRARRAWAGADLDWRRAFVGALVARVTIMPAVRGRNFFDPARVHIEWRA